MNQKSRSLLVTLKTATPFLRKQSHLSFVSREQEAQGRVTQTHPARVRLLSSSCRVTGVGMAGQERQREGNLSEDTDSTGPRSRLYPDSPVPSELFPHL